MSSLEPLGKGCMGSLGVIFSNCWGIYNYLKTKILIKKEKACRLKNSLKPGKIYRTITGDHTQDRIIPVLISQCVKTWGLVRALSVLCH